MVLMYCRECGNRVSSEALECPHCGAPYPTGIRPVLPAHGERNTCIRCGGYTVRTTRVCKRCERGG